MTEQYDLTYLSGKRTKRGCNHTEKTTNKIFGVLNQQKISFDKHNNSAIDAAPVCTLLADRNSSVKKGRISN